MCLNDDIRHGSENASEVIRIVRDFYESILPIPSSFEKGGHADHPLGTSMKLFGLDGWYKLPVLLVLFLFALAYFLSVYMRLAATPTPNLHPNKVQ